MNGYYRFPPIYRTMPRYQLVLLIVLFAGLPFAGLELGGFACVCIACSRGADRGSDRIP